MVVMLFGFLLALFIPSFQLSTDLKMSACVPEWVSELWLQKAPSRAYSQRIVLSVLTSLGAASIWSVEARNLSLFSLTQNSLKSENLWDRLKNIVRQMKNHSHLGQKITTEANNGVPKARRKSCNKSFFGKWGHSKNCTCIWILKIICMPKLGHILRKDLQILSFLPWLISRHRASKLWRLSKAKF